MSGLLYFEPTDEKLPEDYAGRVAPNTVAEVMGPQTPSKGHGLLKGGYSYQRNNEQYKIKLNLDAQTWLQIPDSKCFVGVNNDDLPTPDDLAKDKQLPGHIVQGWNVPYAKTWSDDCKVRTSLPQYVVQRDGKWVTGTVVDEWLEFEKLAGDVLEWWLGKPDRVVFDVVMPWILGALQVNYDIGNLELQMMAPEHRIDTSQLFEFTDAIIDIPGLNDHLKKKSRAAQLITTAGERENCRVTVPA